MLHLFGFIYSFQGYHTQKTEHCVTFVKGKIRGIAGRQDLHENWAGVQVKGFSSKFDVAYWENIYFFTDQSQQFIILVCEVRNEICFNYFQSGFMYLFKQMAILLF